MLKRISLIVLMVAMLTACSDDEPEKKIIRPVKTLVVKQAKDTIIRSFPGKVIASEEAVLSFLVTGQLIKLPVLEGQEVKRGQTLATLEPTQYREAYNEANANFVRNEAHYLRAKQLVKNKYISEADYDTRKSMYLSSKAKMNRAKKDLDDTVMKAPFRGVISVKYVDNYEFVKAKQKVLKLQNLDNVDIEINVPENVVVNLKGDQSQAKPLTVILDALPAKKYTAKFKEYSAEADPETQTYRVVLIMPTPKDAKVLPGMTATIRVELPDFKSGGQEFIDIPAGAVLSDKNKKPFVWIVDEKSMTVKKRLVSVSRMANDEIHVLSGLKPGDRVVVGGVHFIQEGQKISLLEDKPTK